MAHEFDGKKYEKASAHQKEWGAKLIDELELQGNETVLDLGCGDGVNTALMAKLLPQGKVIGIDASKGMIEAAKPKESDNLQFTLMNIDDINFENEFDVIFSNATLHWVKNHSQLFENVFTALRPEGVLKFNFAGKGNCAHFFKVVLSALDHPQFSPYFSKFVWPWYMPSIEDYREVVSSSPFGKVRVWGENADRFFPDSEALIRWIDQPSLVPLLPYIAQADKADFREYIVREMIRETEQDDGRCFETFRRINLFAKKTAPPRQVT